MQSSLALASSNRDSVKSQTKSVVAAAVLSAAMLAFLGDATAKDTGLLRRTAGTPMLREEFVMRKLVIMFVVGLAVCRLHKRSNMTEEGLPDGGETILRH